MNGPSKVFHCMAGIPRMQHQTSQLYRTASGTAIRADGDAVNVYTSRKSVIETARCVYALTMDVSMRPEGGASLGIEDLYVKRGYCI